MIIGRKIIHFDQIDSTNDEARRLVQKGEGEGVVVVADFQTRGRGKPGSGWFSPPGLGVYLSAVVRPFKNANAVSDITLAAARAAAAALKNEFNLEARIKPPNDVLVEQKKICGILVERDAAGNTIIGIGLNVNNPAGSFPAELADSAVSLKIATGKEQNLWAVVRALLKELDREYLAYLGKI